MKEQIIYNEAVPAIAEVHALKSQQDAMKLDFYRLKFQS
jgi:hypothetical protein